MGASTGEACGPTRVMVTDLVLPPKFIRKPDCDSQSAAWFRFKICCDYFPCYVENVLGGKGSTCGETSMEASLEKKGLGAGMERLANLRTWLSLVLRKTSSKFTLHGLRVLQGAGRNHIFGKP